MHESSDSPFCQSRFVLRAFRFSEGRPRFSSFVQYNCWRAAPKRVYSLQTQAYIYATSGGDWKEELEAHVRIARCVAARRGCVPDGPMKGPREGLHCVLADPARCCSLRYVLQRCRSICTGVTGATRRERGFLADAYRRTSWSAAGVKVAARCRFGVRRHRRALRIETIGGLSFRDARAQRIGNSRCADVICARRCFFLFLFLFFGRLN